MLYLGDLAMWAVDQGGTAWPIDLPAAASDVGLPAAAAGPAEGPVRLGIGCAASSRDQSKLNGMANTRDLLYSGMFCMYRVLLDIIYLL